MHGGEQMSIIWPRMRMKDVPTVDELVARQRQFLALPKVCEFIATNGTDAPLWPYGPSAADLARACWPKWQDTIRRILIESR